MKKSSIMFFLLAFLISGASRSFSSTLVLEGSIDDEIDVTQERTFTIPADGLNKLTFRFANTASFKNTVLEQSLSNHRLFYSPEPDSVTTDKDSFGNAFTVATWKNPRKNIDIRENFKVTLKINLRDVKSGAPFPLPPDAIPADEKKFLSPTPLAQSEDEGIKRLAKSLTKDDRGEQAAVMSVLNWVVDNIKYKTPPEKYDALWTLSTGQGNCQNFSHISIALLRSLGIPARVVGGVSLGKAWRVPLKEGALLQTIGQGGHAWMEVWYPDLGWVPYDAQQSHLFVGPRHIKQTVGLDSNDINDSWRASPVLPPFREDISAEYLRDMVAVSLKETMASPRNYIMTTSSIPLTPVLTPPPEAPKGPVRIKGREETEFGNMDFPSLTDFYVKVRNGSGQKTFDKETAEYVTGESTFAQAFSIERSLRVDTVSLAMHKFGGRLGSLWIDIVKDENNRPGMEGVRSLPLSLDSVSYTPGYKWFDFVFSRDEAERPVLAPGRYWIVLRHSKDAVVNWFYTPGNPYGSPDDARSTGKGINWSDIMNHDFNFRVRGVYLREGV